MRPFAERHGLTMLQLACAWNLAQPGVRCVAPTLIQEAGAGARPVEDKRAELAAVAAGARLSAEEVRSIREIGDNSGCMTLKGASLEHDGPPRADRWDLDEELSAVARRWSIDPPRDLAAATAVGAEAK
jgi:Ser/Thr protein kinase RdoA (MazF antagonist)